MRQTQLGKEEMREKGIWARKMVVVDVTPALLRAVPVRSSPWDVLFPSIPLERRFCTCRAEGELGCGA